jgi:adenylate kinase family enzyme
MKWIAPRGFDYSTSDESISKHVANQLITADPMMTHQGYILEGFPFTVKQALLLDRFVQGINLAIYFRH